jgi:hypothetical protein
MSEYAVIHKIKTITIDKLNPYLTAGGLPNVNSGNVRIDAIDPSIVADIAIWIQADRTNFEIGSICEDNAQTFVRVFIIVRGAANETLYERLYKTAAYYREMICENPTLEGEALHAHIASFQYFETVEGSAESRAVEISIETLHEEPRS